MDCVRCIIYLHACLFLVFLPFSFTRIEQSEEFPNPAVTSCPSKGRPWHVQFTCIQSGLFSPRCCVLHPRTALCVSTPRTALSGYGARSWRCGKTIRFALCDLPAPLPHSLCQYGNGGEGDTLERAGREGV